MFGEESGRRIKDIPQGTVLRNLPEGTMVHAGLNYGSCVFGVATEGKNNLKKFAAGHFQAGEIITELQALARIGGGQVTVYQSETTGEIRELYVNGRKLNAKQIKKLFKNRDRGFF